VVVEAAAAEEEKEADFVFNVYSIRAWHSSQETRHGIFSSLFSFLFLSFFILSKRRAKDIVRAHD